MKNKIITLLITMLVVIPTVFNTSVKAETNQEDIGASFPKIEKKSDRVFIVEGQEFNPADYFINPNNSKGRIVLLGNNKDKLKEHGTHNVQFLIFNNQGITVENVEVVVLSQKEYDDCVEYISYDLNGAYLANMALADLKGDGTTTKAYELAQKYIGMGGTCLEVAFAFTREYQGERFKNFDNYKEVSVFEAAPGDIIYYQNGGIGYEHWAVYLGGDLALQGNYLGGTVIGKVYLNNASDPQFRRLY